MHESRQQERPSSRSNPPELSPEVQQLEERGYTLENELSRGAMGVVYQATRKETGEAVAIKLLIQESESRQRFDHELEILQALDHPNIVRYVESGALDSKRYLVMNLIRGRDLGTVVEDTLRRGEPLDEISAISIMSKVAEALAYCHSRGVIHRDIKPQNLILEDRTGRPVLVDFGLVGHARATENGGSLPSFETLTQEGELLGTPAFMAPEQFSPGGSFGDVDLASDVWGFGATFFYLLTGRPPYPGNNLMTIFQEIYEREPPRARSLSPEIPEWLDTLVAACLSREPAERPTLVSIAEDLHQDRSPRSWFFPILVLTLIMTLALIMALFSARSEPQLRLDSDPFPILVSSEQIVTITGIVEGLDRGRVRVQREKTLLDSQGRFSLTCPISWKGNEKKQELKLSVKGPDDFALDRSLIILRDRTPPEITFPRFDQDGFFELSDDVLPGRIFDENLAEASWFFENKPSVPLVLRGDGAFEISLGQHRQPVLVTIRAIDKVGMESSQTIGVITREGAGSRSLYLRNDTWAQARKRLKDLDSWQRAKPRDRREAAFCLAFRLEKDYDFLGLRRFECGGVEANIARYRHRASGIIFHLIPGGFERGSKFQRVKTLLELIGPNAKLDDILKQLSELKLLGAETLRMLGFAFRISAFKDVSELRQFLKGPEGPEVIQGILVKFDQVCAPEANQEDVKSFVEVYRLFPQLLTIEPFLLAARETTVTEAAALGLISQNKRSSLPCVELSFHDLTRSLKAAGALRLPTFDEWRHSCQGGSTSAFFWGDNPEEMARYCWVDLEKSREGFRLRSVEDHKDATNAFGLSDTLGNAGELGQQFEDGRWVCPVLGGDPARLPLLTHRNVFVNRSLSETGPFQGFRLARSIPD